MSRAFEEKVIECVRGHECLFNHKCKNYKDAALKQDVWEQIASELNSTASECKVKWNLLRNAFVHAISRRKTVTGQGVKNLKKWKFEEEMSFLLPFMTHRNTISNIDDSEQDQDSELIQEDSNDNNIQQRKQKDKNYYQEQILNVMKSRINNKPEKNEIDLFFEAMAKTVKKFPKKEQIKLKFDIMKMIHEVEIRCLDSSPPQYMPQSPSSPQIAHQSPSPATQQFSSPQYTPQSPSSPQIAQQSPSPVTQQFSSPQYTPQSPSSPQIAQQSPSPVTQQFSSPQYTPQSPSSPQIAQQSPSPVTQQFFSPQYMSQSPSSSQIAQQSPSPVTQQFPSPQYAHQYVHQYVPQSSQYSNKLQPSTSQIPHTRETSEMPMSQQSDTYYEGPAKSLLQEFLIVKKR